jgi:hypothetical protein
MTRARFADLKGDLAGGIVSSLVAIPLRSASACSPSSGWATPISARAWWPGFRRR